MKKELILSLLCLFGLFKSYGAEYVHSQLLSKKCTFRPITPDIDTQEELDGDEDQELEEALEIQTINENKIKTLFTTLIPITCQDLVSKQKAIKPSIKTYEIPKKYIADLDKIHTALEHLRTSCFSFDQLRGTYKQYQEENIFYFEVIAEVINDSLNKSILKNLMVTDKTKEQEFQFRYITSGSMSTSLQKDLEKPLDILFENLHIIAELYFIHQVHEVLSQLETPDAKPNIKTELEKYIKNSVEFSEILNLYCTGKTPKKVTIKKDKEIKQFTYFGKTEQSSFDKISDYANRLKRLLIHNPISIGNLKYLLNRIINDIETKAVSMNEEQKRPFLMALGFFDQIDSILETTEDESTLSPKVAAQINTLINLHQESILLFDIGVL
ncbi:hypothetical protein K9K77_00605 [Candidatus Babeliales bacterium]|nr:hypothetical protein [Candidatus Babeliales bacterium]